MSKAKMGAVVLYCGHDASFVADVYRVGNVNVIIANGHIDHHLERPASKDCTHHIDDNVSCVWKPHKGFFVVPHGHCRELKEKGV